MVLVTAAVALGAGATAASAENPVDITFCGDDRPRIDLDGVLPGELRTVDVELCNEGATTGALSVKATGGGGVLGDVVHVDLDGRWRGPVNGLPVTLDAAELAPGERDTFTVGVVLDPGAGNALANRRVRFHLHITLAGDEAAVDIPVVAGASTARPLVRTGIDVTAPVVVATALIATGAVVRRRG